MSLWIAKGGPSGERESYCIEHALFDVPIPNDCPDVEGHPDLNAFIKAVPNTHSHSVPSMEIDLHLAWNLANEVQEGDLIVMPFVRSMVWRIGVFGNDLRRANNRFADTISRSVDWHERAFDLVDLPYELREFQLRLHVLERIPNLDLELKLRETVETGDPPNRGQFARAYPSIQVDPAVLARSLVLREINHLGRIQINQLAGIVGATPAHEIIATKTKQGEVDVLILAHGTEHGIADTVIAVLHRDGLADNTDLETVYAVVEDWSTNDDIEIRKVILLALDGFSPVVRTNALLKQPKALLWDSYDFHRRIIDATTKDDRVTRIIALEPMFIPARLLGHLDF